MTHADTSNGGPGAQASAGMPLSARPRPLSVQGRHKNSGGVKKINEGLMAGDRTDPDGGIHLVGDRTCVM